MSYYSNHLAPKVIDYNPDLQTTSPTAPFLTSVYPSLAIPFANPLPLFCFSFL